MLTDSIYLKNSYEKTCAAKILRITINGKNAKIILDKTVFYPEGGGQPSDHGLIQSDRASFKVEQVLLTNNEIVHSGILAEGTMEINDTVTCVLDWNTRYKNMQIHTAGHLLHEAIHKLYPKLTPIEGKHGSKAFIKYEGHGKKISPDKILDICNELRSKKLKVFSEFVTLDELKKRSSYLPPHLPSNKPLRIVWFDGFEPIPDGGTQLKSTSELPPFEKITIKKSVSETTFHYTLTKSINKSEPKSAKKIPQTENIEMNSDVIMNIKNQALAQIMEATGVEELENIRASYLGRQGKISQLIKELKNIPSTERKLTGSLLNEVKNTLIKEIASRKNSFKETKREWFDPTYPGVKYSIGHKHPTTFVIDKMFNIFKHLGFSVMEGPEIETDVYNFEKLNLPKYHPARSLQDVLYIKEPEILLRSHTSSVETRSLEKLKPPFRIVVAGKCYRFENVNASNNAMFYQFQGVALQEGLSMADLKGTLFYFVKEFFGKERKIRFRCKYYPEVEPGGGLDLDCPFCEQKGCSVCKGRGWLEILGCGMIHPSILKGFGYNPDKISGFAFGMGLDRIVMDKFKIKDIRSLYNGDLRY